MTDTYCIDYDDYLADANEDDVTTTTIKVMMMSNDDDDDDSAMSFSNR